MKAKENPFIPIDLSDMPVIDEKKFQNELIEAKKVTRKIIKDSKELSKPRKCYYCNEPCDGFCNSHTVPESFLTNISEGGKLLYHNSISYIPTLKKEKGLKESGTFNLICRKCDGKIFQEYEHFENYNSTPTSKMIAQMEMKVQLHNISKRIMEIEMYSLQLQQGIIDEASFAQKKQVSEMDLAEFNKAYHKAKSSSKKKENDNYTVGLYKKLNYTVPVAFQGSVALIADLCGKCVNNVYNTSPKYSIKYMTICIFPLEGSSVILAIVDRDNHRYREFFKQLNALCLSDCLSVINYILFAYCEDFFLSPKLSEDILEKLKDTCGKNPNFLAIKNTTISEQREYAEEMFSLSQRNEIPNLLLREHSMEVIK